MSCFEQFRALATAFGIATGYSDGRASRILWFERDQADRRLLRRADQYPTLALAAVGNHDLTTVIGLFTGSDLRHRLELRLLQQDNLDAAREADRNLLKALVRLLCEEGVLATDATADLGAVIDAAHEFLARTPAMLIAIRLEDVLELTDRVNLPGTSSKQRPQNWNLRLPTAVEPLRAHPRIRQLKTLRLKMH